METWIVVVAIVGGLVLLGAGSQYLETKEALKRWRNRAEDSEGQLRELRQRVEREEEEFGSHRARIQAEKQEIAEHREEMMSEVETLAREKSVGFPWLAEAYAEYFAREYENTARWMEIKPNPAFTSADQVRVLARNLRQVERARRILNYVVKYYETLFPWLEELRDPNIDDDLISSVEGGGLSQNRTDPVQKWLTPAEYERLDSAEKSDLALERYAQRKKSNWEIGRDYERYVGYKMEQDGYAVSYQGIIEGLADLGRDLVCTRSGTVRIIQCKRWSTHKEIHEKHVFQLFGTLTAYKIDHEDDAAEAVLVTSTKLSPRAREFAHALHIAVWDEFPPGEYPIVKCNVARETSEKIYHLPFDQMYDRTVIEPGRGERYVWTAAEAEVLGFRRAFKWQGDASQASLL